MIVEVGGEKETVRSKVLNENGREFVCSASSIPELRVRNEGLTSSTEVRRRYKILKFT